MKLFSAENRGGKKFISVKDLTESVNWFLGKCGMRVQSKGKRKGMNVQRGTQKYELVEEEILNNS